MARRPKDDEVAGVTLAPRSKAATEKRCKTCTHTKPAAEFWRALSLPDLLSENCRTCTVLNAQRDRADREARHAAAAAKKTKTCNCCKTAKPLTAFAPNRNAKDGRRRTCNVCIDAGTRTRSLRDDAARSTDRSGRKQPHRKATNRRSAREWQKRNPEAVLAREAMRNAVRNGIVVRPERCQVRGCKYVGKPQGHHPDYRYPLFVAWCCPSHHRRLHAGEHLDIVTGLPPELMRVPG